MIKRVLLLKSLPVEQGCTLQDSVLCCSCILHCPVHSLLKVLTPPPQVTLHAAGVHSDHIGSELGTTMK